MFRLLLPSLGHLRVHRQSHVLSVWAFVFLYRFDQFDKKGLSVEIEAQSNWKVLLDRVIDGQLDGAHMLAGQPIGAVDDRDGKRDVWRESSLSTREADGEAGFVRLLPHTRRSGKQSADTSRRSESSSLTECREHCDEVNVMTNVLDPIKLARKEFVLPQFLQQRSGTMTRELLLHPGAHGLGMTHESMLADTVTTASCGFCATGCGLRLHIREGEAVGLTPDTNYPVNLGMACPKGWEALRVLDSDDRATEPLLRGPDGQRRAIACIGADAGVPVTTPQGGTKSLTQALTEDCCLKDPADQLIELVLHRVSDPPIKQDLQSMLDGDVVEGNENCKRFETRVR